MEGIYRNWDTDAYERLIKKLDVPRGKPYKDYSRGMKMKQAIAVALSHHAKLLILDEATSGLDPVVRDEVVETFADFAREEDHSVLISSHIVSDLEKICDTIAFLHKGQLLLCEEKDTLREEYGFLQTTEEGLTALDPGDVLGKRITPYGATVLLRRSATPRGTELSPVNIEDLFVFMIRGEEG